MRQQTENEFMADVREACTFHKVLVYHTHRSDRSDPGYPDLTIVGAKGVLFRELKTATGKVSEDQVEWIDRLTRCGADADVWRPADMQRIHRELRALGQLPDFIPQAHRRKNGRPNARSAASF